MTRYLNKSSEQKTEENKPSVKKHWYRVAILYNPDVKLYYTCIIDKPHHQKMVENYVTFLRWENPVEYTV
jgi:hypothetical protein